MVRKLSAILKQNAISSVNLDDQSDFQMMTVISPSLVVRKHGAPKYCTEIVDQWFLRFGKCIYLRHGKVSCSFTSCNIANPNFVRQSFIFSLYQNQVCLHNEQEKFGKKQRAILRLIKSITKFSNVIGYHQPYLSTLRVSDWLKTDAFFR